MILLFSSFGSCSILSFLSLLLYRNHPLSGGFIKIVSHTTNNITIAMPAENPMVAIKTDDAPDMSSNMIMINARTDSAAPRTETYFTKTWVQLIVLFLRKSVNSSYPYPSGFLFLNVDHLLKDNVSRYPEPSHRVLD